MDRWKEHFQDLLNRPCSTDPNALNNKDKLPCNADMDIPPSLEEIEDAIKSLKNGKAPGADGIPSEVYKYGHSSSHYRSHTGPSFANCNFVTVRDMYTPELGVFMYRFSISDLR